VVAPAGLDLGPIENAEIGVAVMADLVARRAAGQLVSSTAVPPMPVAIDPVCGMAVPTATARYQTVHHGVDFVFCAPGCKAAFEADPDRFVRA
jgi:YHS domain-containing protein